MQDESYFLGIIRFAEHIIVVLTSMTTHSFIASTKMQELTSEITKMRVEIRDLSEDQLAYASFEQKAEGLAKELKV